MTALCDGGNNLSQSSCFLPLSPGFEEAEKNVKKETIKRESNPCRRLKHTIEGNTWNV
jgi:hypothetical protein